MQNEFENDFLDDFVESALKDMIEKWRKEGLSDAEIIKRLNNGDLQSAYECVMKAAKKETFVAYKEHMFEINSKEKAETKEFVARMEQSWGKCFAASQAMYTMAIEYAKEYSQFIFDNANTEIVKDKKYTMLVLQHIHGRACQEFLEILCLLRFGFADGAYARWRSMYELCCNAKFIATYGEQVARKYYEQSETDDHKYTWAAGVLCDNGKVLSKSPTFNDIQDNCDIDSEWKKQYKQACLVNHGSPQGTFKRLANGPGANCIPIGHSNYGIAMPAVQSAISLLWISYLFFSLFPKATFITYTMVMQEWLDFLREQYTETDKHLFEELNENTSEKE